MFITLGWKAYLYMGDNSADGLAGVSMSMDGVDKQSCYFDPLTTVSRATMIRWPYAVFMLDHRLRRWSNIKPALGQRLVFAELVDLVE